ncbi:hypothetical protein E2562_038208 [Oryza meyeriana var. granulata]|uniref:Uncharacterized protein n=1 Tax=Oryza meyeriana var. granulata TaxID=110450 RepID=A0A6G1FGF7_9ORYZ|nr:hypothetical protein E2562_038208 [Oryza meyeriana var. granulata]KAF0936020.1 hypothetical protein E2562_038208 [Oryza meyeriana var. granulata]
MSPTPRTSIDANRSAEMEVAECSPGEKLQIFKASASASMAYSIAQFPVKWQSIKYKLHQLCSNLNAPGDNDSSDEHMILVQFLQTAMATVSHIQAIASQCSDETYNGGRLRLRSDLDNISSKLDVHLKDLKEMVSSRTLVHSQAVIITRPAIDASLSSKRLYINDLFLRVRIGDLAQRNQALVTIGELLSEDIEYVKIVALDIDGSISLLISFLESGDAYIQEQAARILSLIAGYDSYRGVLVKSGVVASLVQLLDSPSTSTVSSRERAAHALRELTSNSDNVWAVCSQGGLTVLLTICANVDSRGKLVSSALAVLKNLSRVEEVRMFMVEEGAILEFVKLSRQKEEERKVGSVELLHCMALADANVRQAAISMGMIQSLTQLINPGLPYSSKAREVALSTIPFFCFPSKTLTDDLISSNVLSWLHSYLNNGDYAVLECTLSILVQLTRISEEYNKMVGRAGFMTALGSLLEAKFYQVREMAAQVLYNLLSLHSNRVVFIQDGDNLKRLLQALEVGDGKTMAKDLTISCLSSLAESSTGRKKITSSEHFGHLKGLADSGDLSAKKIMKRLCSNRFQSILTRIRIS